VRDIFNLWFSCSLLSLWQIYPATGLPPILPPSPLASESSVPATMPRLPLPPAATSLPATTALPSAITINFSGLPSAPVMTATACHDTTHSLPSQPPALPDSRPSAECGDPALELKWAELTVRFNESQLRRHAWEWVGRDKDWLPIYRYQPVTTISDIWSEWAEGVSGFLSVRDLTERWGARWRRNDAGQRTEASRRKKVIDLVTELSSKHLWNVNLALRFLHD
jgi:hypothetical protein